MHIHGHKKQAGGGRKPHIAPDDLVSTSYANIMYGLAEGEIFGLADGGKSIRLDGTPLINDNGQPNFNNVNWEFRNGTLDQTHIAGFAAVENESNVGVELRHDRPWVKAINNRELSAVRVRLNFNALREQKDNGDILGYAIEYAIDVQTDGGSFQEVLRQTVRGKSSQGYKKSHRIDLPKGNKWTLRVRRITPNRNSELIGDTVHIDALTEIIDAKLAYPCTALLGLSYDAKTFSNIAKIAVRLKGKIIQVPSNYSPETRTYTGLWDGTFKPAYSNNPAWVYYDLCTHKRYGLGERLAGMVDKWRLYQIGQYCDELVDDGKGGQEPRFTCNVYIQKADDAYRVLQNLASVFRGLSFWDGSNIVVDSDTPKEPVYTFSAANIVGGEFAYTGTRQRDRHTLTKVAWDNPENGFTTEYELIPDEQAIAKYGVRTLDISAFGCTSQGQAQRAGLWALKAEQLETQTVSFKTGLMGFIPQVGQVINIADNVFAGRAVSGKIVAVSTNKRQITLDRTAGKVGDTLTVNGTDGVQSAKITAVRGQVATLDKPINAEPEHIWAVVSDDLKLKQFRILSIKQNDDATFDITALEYNAQKYRAVDNGAMVTPQPFTVLNATPITAPNSVTLTASNRTHQGQAVTTLSINWEQVAGATAYIVEWRKDDGNWQTLPKVSGQSVDIDGVYGGKYQARVRAVDGFDNESLATSSQLTAIAGKIGKPPRLARLTAKGVLFGMELGWDFNKGSDDTNFTEIQVSPDGRSNITTLGTFAYPTNKHEITGLQGNLTQFYRGRIVDKLGNTSDWTAWTSGTTSADASKVLDILSGQISQSHLDQTLRTPIAKIGTLENAVGAVNGNLGTLNSQLANTQNELATAKSTLQTAVGNITTERNRITSAIRDITALQSANNTKTQELANLAQTVGGHTSSIRELGVTTGDLSQKYSQLKTATDTANSEITAIKQTQSGQATSIERLRSDLNSKANTALVESLRQAMTTDKQSLASRIDAIDTAYKAADTQANAKLATLERSISDKDRAMTERVDSLNANYTALDNRTTVQDTRDDNQLPNWYWTNYPRQIVNEFKRASVIRLSGFGTYVNVETRVYWQDGSGGNIIQTAYHQNDPTKQMQRQSVGRGDAATWGDWQSPFATVADGAKANLDEFKQAQATRDTATTQKLTQLESTVNGVSGRVGTAESKIATLERTASDLNGAIATAQSQLNARFDNLAVGGRNLLRNSGNPYTGNRYMTNWTLAKIPDVGEEVTVTLWGELASDRQAFAVYNTHGYRELARLRQVRQGVYTATFSWRNPLNNRTEEDNSLSRFLNIYAYPRTATSNNTIKQVKLEIGNIATDWTPAPEDSNVDLSPYATNASLDEFKRTQATKDTATAQKLSQLESGLNGKANATALDSLTTKVNQVDGKITAETQKISQLQTTVSGQTASIQQHAQSLDGLKAQYTIKVQTGGVVAGIGLASNNGVSDFAVRADKFYIASPTGQKGSMPFMVLATAQTMNGVQVPAGTYINSAFIQDGSISIAKINKASIDSLSALSANIGTLTTSDSRGTFTYTGSKIELRDPQGRLLMEMGLL